MIRVHRNGDLSSDGRLSLSMYREKEPGRYEAAFDGPCPARLFIGQFGACRPPVAFVWFCRIRQALTSISMCKACLIPEDERRAYGEWCRANSSGTM